MDGRTRTSRRVPMAPKLLGVAGLLPPALAILARLVLGPTPLAAALIVKLGIIYAVLILSFLGGIWWGVAVARGGEERQGPLLALSVTPSMVGLALIALSTVLPFVATVLLAIALATTPLADAWLDGLGLVPAWWMRLRLGLSFGLAALTLGLAALILV